MTTSDLNDTPRPLPLRLEPLPRETLTGYLRRVAFTFHATPAGVVEPISGRWATRLRAGATTRTTAIAMTERTAAATATRLNLSVAQVRAMLASADQDITITFGELAPETFDPATGTATQHDQAGIGWLLNDRFDRYCRHCDRQTHDITQLQWRYPWYAICPTHQCLLRPHCEEENADTDFQDLFETQEDLTDIIDGTSTFTRLSRRDGFIELLAAADVLCWVRGRLRMDPTKALEPWFLARVLPDALTAVQTPINHWPEPLQDLLRGRNPGSFLASRLETRGATSPFGLRADLLRFADRPGQLTRHWAKDIRIPHEHQMTATESTKAAARATFPALMPHRLVVPMLSDYTPLLSTVHAQRAAGLAALMVVTGDTMKEACDSLGNQGAHQVPLRRLWWNLESRGLLHDYFDHIRDAACAMLAGNYSGVSQRACLTMRWDW